MIGVTKGADLREADAIKREPRVIPLRTVIRHIVDKQTTVRLRGFNFITSFRWVRHRGAETIRRKLKLFSRDSPSENREIFHLLYFGVDGVQQMKVTQHIEALPPRKTREKAEMKKDQIR